MPPTATAVRPTATGASPRRPADPARVRAGAVGRLRARRARRRRGRGAPWDARAAPGRCGFGGGRVGRAAAGVGRARRGAAISLRPAFELQRRAQVGRARSAGCRSISSGPGATARRVSSSASGSWPQTQTGKLGRADAAAGPVGEEPLDPAGPRASGRRSRRGARRRASSSQASGSAASSESSSPLTAIRIAWKVRLAGWPRPKRAAGGIAGLDRLDQLGGRLERAAARRSRGRSSRRGAPRRSVADASAIRVSGHSLTRSRGGQLCVGIHPHVERRVVGVGEAALPGVDLHRGHPEVHVDHVGRDAFAAQARRGPRRSRRG